MAFHHGYWVCRYVILASNDRDMVANDVSSIKDIRNCWASGSHGVSIFRAGAIYRQAAIGHILHPWGMPMSTSNSSELALPILYVVWRLLR